MHRWDLSSLCPSAELACDTISGSDVVGETSCIETGIAIQFLEANELSDFAVNPVTAALYTRL
ncbi:hypothetical protein GJ744_006789 [Endocarpon pusillum]|uniref:Uncharacterized protein n=1 Tax=Endocarpon pusillum TaxID=364733 RepID=A0A8H7AJJ8_9EURO|nr:hypothetical protein GJ744_006789 [Endocarpon pusillum]